MTKRYSFINRKTGKTANIKGVNSREEARAVKRDRSFAVAIWDNVNGSFVR